MSAFLLAFVLVQEPRALEDFSRGIEQAFRKGDPEALDRAVDLEALLDRALAGLKADPKLIAGFRAGAGKSLGLGKATAQQLGKDGSYTFLRLRTVDGKRRALFRMLVGETFSYQEFLLDPRPGGEIKILDVYVHLSAEWMSETFRRSFVSILAKEPGALAKALGAENEVVKALPRIEAFSKLVREGKYPEALQAFAELPAPVRSDKNLLVLRCSAANQVGGKEALEALEDLKRAVPGDPCIAVLSIVPLTEAGRHDDALKAADELDRALGGDPFLHVLRSWIHSGAGRADRARESARKAIEGEKGLAIAYWTLVNLTLQEKKFGETAKVLSELEKNTGIRVDELKGEQFAEFLKSPEFEAWRKSRAKP